MDLTRWCWWLVCVVSQQYAYAVDKRDTGNSSDQRDMRNRSLSPEGAVAMKCNSLRFASDHGFLNSPNFPGRYPDNCQCTWTIEVPSEFTELRLSFQKFNVENPKWAPVCLKDYVQIFHFPLGRRELKNTFCGKKMGFNVTVNGNKAEVFFSSDAFKTRKGFRLLWTSALGDGGKITGSQGLMKLSPWNPLKNSRNFFAEWRIIAPSTTSWIELKIRSLNFDLDLVSCEKAFIAIVDGADMEIAKYCSPRIPTTVRIPGFHARVLYKVHKRSENQSFEASWNFVEVSEPELDCGWSTTEALHHRSRRVVGGSATDAGVAPWMVQVNTHFLGNSLRVAVSKCGGVLINRKHILTAAHCITKSTPVIRHEVIIRHVTTHLKSTFQLIKIPAIDDFVIIHPEYKLRGNRGRPMNDIGLLRLPSKLDYDAYVQPICLPGRHVNSLERESSHAQKCTFTGFGMGSIGSSGATRFNTIPAQVWGHCDGADSVVCVLYGGRGSGACKGDSGSPVICEHDDGRKYVAGILSYGGLTCPSVVDGFTDINYYIPWVESIVKTSTANPSEPHNESNQVAD